jgi:hypothetical protein
MVKRPLPSFAARSRERGATLFVVLLVIMLLMGIGILSARSAQLATQASGSERQMTQTRYVAEYGVMFATAKLSNGGAQAYMNAMRGAGNPPVPPPADVCFAQSAGPPSVPIDRTCYKMSAGDISTELGFPVCDQMNAQGNATCDFVLELTDLGEGFTLPGFSLGHGKALKFWYVTATATGQVRRTVDPTATTKLDLTAGESSSTQTLRSRILVGPFPSN